MNPRVLLLLQRCSMGWMKLTHCFAAKVQPMAVVEVEVLFQELRGAAKARVMTKTVRLTHYEPKEEGRNYD